MRTLVLLVLLSLAAPAAAAQDTLTVVTLNIWHNRGDWPARLELIARELGALRPDVVLLQEVLQDVGLPNQAETIARALGLPHVHFVSVDSADAVKRYGNAVLSAHPFVETAMRALRPLDQFRTAAYARIEVGGRPVRLYATHLHHVADAEGGGIRAMEIRDLLDFVEATDAPGVPLIVGGDFNAEPDWPEMRLMAPFRDLYARFHVTEGVTFGPPYTGAPGRRIDYLFDASDPRLVPVAAGVALDRPDAAGLYPSDHFAVYARFVLP